MEKVILLVIAELEKPFENSQHAYMCNIANFLWTDNKISIAQCNDFKALIAANRPADAHTVGLLAWYPMNDSDKRINFLKELLTKI